MKLSTGQDSTLGNYRRLTVLVFGPESRAVAYLDEKIAAQGADEPVIVDERQMLHLLAHIDGGGS